MIFNPSKEEAQGVIDSRKSERNGFGVTPILQNQRDEMAKEVADLLFHEP